MAHDRAFRSNSFGISAYNRFRICYAEFTLNRILGLIVSKI
ncbi:hypothetical protein LEP1GSC021_0072 [Leptospira noguchii str. 1993005606]|nr:hypothetical protein LEP1GSC021_0072 [Leptospira noguchii str. 1993005606]